MSIEKRVAYWIRHYRKKSKLHQSQLAQKLWMVQGSVGHWEREARPISLRNLEAVAIALNVDICKFFEPIPEQKQSKKFRTFEELRADLGNAIQVEVRKR